MMKKFGRKALALSLTAVLGASMVLQDVANQRAKTRRVKTQQQRLVLQQVWLLTQQQIFLL